MYYMYLVVPTCLLQPQVHFVYRSLQVTNFYDKNRCQSLGNNNENSTASALIADIAITDDFPWYAVICS